MIWIITRKCSSMTQMNWKKFKNKISSIYDLEIPSNRNQTISEINHYISKIEEFIHKANEWTVPRYTSTDNVLNYITHKINKLHKYKSFLITTLNKQYKSTYSVSSLNIPFLKIINKINDLLKNENQTSYTKYWNCQLTQIDHRNPDKFFPEINRFFRPKEQLKINGSNCSINDLRVENNKYIIENPPDILNVIGSFYEKINSPFYHNADTPLKRKVDNKVNLLIENFSRQQ